MSDVVALEVFRSRLESIAEQGGLTIERTAISPVVTDSKDYSSTILTPGGELVAGGGRIEHHFYAATNAVRGVLERHGESLAEGDVFLANDPHNGGGLHAQDVFVLTPVFCGETHVAWVANSAHMMDMGGMVPGSFSPNATECFQEAIRFPPVRLVTTKGDNADVWSILKNNIRMAELIEMDVRGLVAGCHVASTELTTLVDEVGPASYAEMVEELLARTERAVRRRISQLADGEYSAVSFSEWDDERVRVPCRMTIAGDSLRLDFEGATPQTNHFFNSKQFIIASSIGADYQNLLSHDLPYNHGLFRALEIACPEGSVLDSKEPAPVAAAHIDVAQVAVEVAIQCLMLAISASEASDLRPLLTAGSPAPGTALHSYAATGWSGMPENWVMLDGGATGSPAAQLRDGTDFSVATLGERARIEFVDVETIEAWYPVRVLEKGRANQSGGEGANRSGDGLVMAMTPATANELSLTVLSNRFEIPFPGFAGGLPGRTSHFELVRPDGATTLGAHDQGVPVEEGSTVRFVCATGGGYGDPLDRPYAAVDEDIEAGRLAPQSALSAYGVVVGDEPGTEKERAARRAARLEAATPARKPVGATSDDPQGTASPLYPGVTQVGRFAVSERTGTVLAEAPDCWLDGCPTLDLTPEPNGVGHRVTAYLDPTNGAYLCVDVASTEDGRSFSSMPHRWVAAAEPSAAAAAGA